MRQIAWSFLSNKNILFFPWHFLYFSISNIQFPVSWSRIDSGKFFWHLLYSVWCFVFYELMCTVLVPNMSSLWGVLCYLYLKWCKKSQCKDTNGNRWHSCQVTAKPVAQQQPNLKECFAQCGSYVSCLLRYCDKIHFIWLQDQFRLCPRSNVEE